MLLAYSLHEPYKIHEIYIHVNFVYDGVGAAICLTQRFNDESNEGRRGLCSLIHPAIKSLNLQMLDIVH